MTGRRFTLRIEPLARTVEVAGDASLLEAASQAGIRLPVRAATARAACLCRLSSGEVRYRIEWPGLAADEKADGWILPCVAVAASDVTISSPRRPRKLLPPAG